MGSLPAQDVDANCSWTLTVEPSCEICSKNAFAAGSQEKGGV